SEPRGAGFVPVSGALGRRRATAPIVLPGRCPVAVGNRPDGRSRTARSAFAVLRWTASPAPLPMLSCPLCLPTRTPGRCAPWPYLQQEWCADVGQMTDGYRAEAC